MPRYSKERKQAILSKLQLSSNMSVAQVSRNEGISLQTLYNWRNEARHQGHPMSSNHTNPNDWTSASPDLR